MKPDTIVKPTSLRQYIYEYAIIALAVAVITLFKMYIDMNGFIRNELRDIVIKSTVTIEANNALLKEKSQLR
jgi:hypothetical protein